MSKQFRGEYVHMERQQRDQEQEAVSAVENISLPELPTFTLEYVSGQITVPASSEIVVEIFGHAGSGHAHVYVTQHFLSSMLQIYDSGVVFVTPMRSWGSRIRVPNPEEGEAVPVSVTIFVSSEFLIPTLEVRLYTAPGSLNQSLPTNLIYYKPGDFAVFRLQSVMPAGAFIRQRLW